MADTTAATPRRAVIPAAEREVIRQFNERRRVLRDSALNVRLWSIIDAARELSERIRVFDDEYDSDEPARLLEGAGLEVPNSGAECSPRTYDEAANEIGVLRNAMLNSLDDLPTDLLPPTDQRTTT